MRRGILRSLAIVVAVAAALVAGLALAPLRPGATDARFADAEITSTGTLVTTRMPTISFGDPTTANGTTITYTWKLSSAALPGQTYTFTPETSGLVILSGATTSSSVTSTTGGTVTLSLTGLPTGAGSYDMHVTTSVGGWSTAGTNYASESVLCILACAYGGASYPSGP